MYCTVQGLSPKTPQRWAEMGRASLPIPNPANHTPVNTTREWPSPEVWPVPPFLLISLPAGIWEHSTSRMGFLTTPLASPVRDLTKQRGPCVLSGGRGRGGQLVWSLTWMAWNSWGSPLRWEGGRGRASHAGVHSAGGRARAGLGCKTLCGAFRNRTREAGRRFGGHLVLPELTEGCRLP